MALWSHAANRANVSAFHVLPPLAHGLRFCCNERNRLGQFAGESKALRMRHANGKRWRDLWLYCFGSLRALTLALIAIAGFDRGDECASDVGLDQTEEHAAPLILRLQIRNDKRGTKFVPIDLIPEGAFLFEQILHRVEAVCDDLFPRQKVGKPGDVLVEGGAVH